jgi:hypothetical protein
VTAVLLDPVTVAVIVLDCPLVSEADVGVTPTDTGTSESVTLAVVPVDAWLAAVTVTEVADAIEAGAVYTPFDMVPT